jgi:hypothetical protein
MTECFQRGGMLRARMGCNPDQDFINIFLLVLYKKICNFQLSYQKNSKHLREAF